MGAGKEGGEGGSDRDPESTLPAVWFNKVMTFQQTAGTHARRPELRCHGS